MDREFWAHCSGLIRRTQAEDLGCDETAFDSNELVVVPRPAKVLYPEYAALVVSFGTGTVVSVEEVYVEWVRAHPPRRHWWAFGADFLADLVQELGMAGVPAIARSTALGFALAERPSAIDLPHGFRLAPADRAWMMEWRQGQQFQNALGDAEEADWFDRLRTAFVIFDEEGEAVAATAVADDGNGCMEIGLDVRRAWRGKGLARPVTLAASAWVLEQGAVPYYTCNASNVRSHLVAESCGYRGLWSVTGVAEA